MKKIKARRSPMAAIVTGSLPSPRLEDHPDLVEVAAQIDLQQRMIAATEAHRIVQRELGERQAERWLVLATGTDIDTSKTYRALSRAYDSAAQAEATRTAIEIEVATRQVEMMQRQLDAAKVERGIVDH